MVVRKNIIYVTFTFFSIVIAFFFASKIFADHKSIENNVTAYNMQNETSDKVKIALKNASIPHRINANTENTYDLIVDNKYVANAVMTLFQSSATPLQPTVETMKQVLADELLFSKDISDILMQDFCNKVKRYEESKTQRDQQICLLSQRTLENYMSRILLDIDGVSDAFCLISNYENFSFAIHIQTTENVNESDIYTIEQFISNNMNGTIVKFEEIDKDKFILEGIFEWELPEYIVDIIDIEYNKSDSTANVSLPISAD